MSENTKPAIQNGKPRRWGWLLLFTSLSTLLCCALPILLVSLGMGAVVAAMAANLPFLVTLSLHKIWIFAGSGLCLVIGGYLLFIRPSHCPSDPVLGKLCAQTRKWNIRFYWIAAGIWSIGFTTAYILPLLMD